MGEEEEEAVFKRTQKRSPRGLAVMICALNPENSVQDPRGGRFATGLPQSQLRVIFPQCGKPCLTPIYTGEVQIGAAEAEAAWSKF